MSNIIFKDDKHRKFYEEMVSYTHSENDVYRKSFFYTLGILPETRDNINSLYSFKERGIQFEGLNESWQTSGTLKISRLAFNLYNGFCYSIDDWGDCKICTDDSFTPYNLFCNPDALYMLEACKIRFPEYFKR